MRNNCKIIVVLLLLVGVFAVTLDEAHKELDSLTNIASQNVQVGLRELNNQGNKFRVLSEQVLSEGSSLVSQEYFRLLKEFNYVVLYAEHAGVNATSCTKSKDVVLKQIGDISTLEVVACVDRFLSQAQESTTKAMIEFNEILEILYKLRRELAACPDNNGQACIDGTFQQIKFQELDVPRRIEESLNLATNKAEANKLLLMGCGTREAERMLSQGGKVIAEVEKCVDHLIENPPKPS